ncbi:hypothetical protein WN944_009373 [Citrus x changshan-huyou]|uniref:Uncharacterized protein n=1 Tax=Citrus x changshan-huyou TaxID=2935761 RepID=A0AAP0QZR8_9ROSI
MTGPDPDAIDVRTGLCHALIRTDQSKTPGCGQIRTGRVFLPPLSAIDAALHATFRQDASLSNFSSLNNVIGKSVMPEPFDFPGMLVQQGKGEEFLVSDSPKEGVKGSILRFVWFLGWIKGMKLYPWRLRTEWAYSFMMEIGISESYPISFVAKRSRRNFLLAPLLSFRDEAYTTSPGMLVLQGADHELVFTDSSSAQCSSVFRLVAGLHGRAEKIPLKPLSQKICLISIYVLYPKWHAKSLITQYHVFILTHLTSPFSLTVLAAGSQQQQQIPAAPPTHQPPTVQQQQQQIPAAAASAITQPPHPPSSHRASQFSLTSPFSLTVLAAGSQQQQQIPAAPPTHQPPTVQQQQQQIPAAAASAITQPPPPTVQPPSKSVLTHCSRRRQPTAATDSSSASHPSATHRPAAATTDSSSSSISHHPDTLEAIMCSQHWLWATSSRGGVPEEEIFTGEELKDEDEDGPQILD